MWAEVAEQLELEPVRTEIGTLVLSGERRGRQLELGVGTLLEGMPVWLRILSPEPSRIDCILVPAHAMITSPALRTGDPAFDEVVSIAAGHDRLLSWLDPEVRSALAAACALGATIDATGATLAPPAAAALADTAAVLTAADRLCDAVAALRPPSMQALVRRYRQPDATAVARAVIERVESALPSLDQPLLDEVIRAVLAHAEDPERVLAPVADRPDVKRTLLRGVIEDRLRRFGPAVDRWEEWLFRQPFFAEEALAATARLPAPECAALLFALVPESDAAADTLIRRLGTLDDPLVTRRVTALLFRAPAAAASVLARRALAAIRDERDAELDRIAATSEHPAVFDALLALPPEATAWLSGLRPSASVDRLRLIERLEEDPRPETEAALLHWLDGSELAERIAAARALRLAGTGASVPALSELAEGWLVEGSLRNAARTALAAIRRRNPVGGLSVAQPLGGDLSIREEE